MGDPDEQRLVHASRMQAGQGGITLGRQAVADLAQWQPKALLQRDAVDLGAIGRRRERDREVGERGAGERGGGQCEGGAGESGGEFAAGLTSA